LWQFFLRLGQKEKATRRKRKIAHFGGAKAFELEVQTLENQAFVSMKAFEPKTPADLAHRIMWIRCVECAEKNAFSRQRDLV